MANTALKANRTTRERIERMSRDWTVGDIVYTDDIRERLSEEGLRKHYGMTNRTVGNMLAAMDCLKSLGYGAWEVVGNERCTR